MLVLQLVHEKYFKNTLDFTSVSFIKYRCRTKRINVVVAITSIVQYVNLVHSKGKKYSTTYTLIITCLPLLSVGVQCHHLLSPVVLPLSLKQVLVQYDIAVKL
jgi:hypothetical protein